MRDRGGFEEVRRKTSLGRPNDIRIACDVRLGHGLSVRYSIRLSSDSARSYYVKEEDCQIYRHAGKEIVDFFTVRDGTLVESSRQSAGKIRPDRLYLVAAGATEVFEPIFDILSHIAVYQLDPAEMKTPQYHDPGEFLVSSGSNMASVIGRLKTTHPDAWATVLDYLQAIVPGIVNIDSVPLGSRLDLDFEFLRDGRIVHFPSISVSEGTIRALGLLMALFQQTDSKPDEISLVGLEEPESALHPGAMNALISAMTESADAKKQVIASTHSPELLDRKDIKPSSLIAVSMADGVTSASSIDTVSTSVIKDRLYSPGQLLRMGQLR